MDHERLLKQPPTTCLFTYSPGAWARIADDIARIDCYAFSDGNDIERVRDRFSEPNFQPSQYINVLLKSPDGSVIGYSQAEQSWTKTSARIIRTALAPEYQHQGLVGPLMTRMEQELRSRGVTNVHRKVRTQNGYADAIRRHYGARIVADYSDGIRAQSEHCFRIKI